MTPDGASLLERGVAPSPARRGRVSIPDANGLRIITPKRTEVRRFREAAWGDFFSYYAGFSESFANGILESANLHADALIWDPWNGSGTTTYISSMLGLPSIGTDLNPVMKITAAARALNPSDALQLQDHWNSIRRRASLLRRNAPRDDPLTKWFTRSACTSIRRVESALAEGLLHAEQVDDATSVSILSAIYVALFLCSRAKTTRFRTSNPTWLKGHSPGLRPVRWPLHQLLESIDSYIEKMDRISRLRPPIDLSNHSYPTLKVADSTDRVVEPEFIDFVLASPPYCTRLDYTAATSLELAILQPSLAIGISDLSREMMGTTRVPKQRIELDKKWGVTCLRFLKSVQNHKSKASAVYYYPTYLDYFRKLYLSLCRIAESLKPGGRAALVIQDSYYKDQHNNLPKIVTEILTTHGMRLERLENFSPVKSLGRINRYRSKYHRDGRPTESVLCFSKHATESFP